MRPCGAGSEGTGPHFSKHGGLVPPICVFSAALLMTTVLSLRKRSLNVLILNFLILLSVFVCVF